MMESPPSPAVGTHTPSPAYPQKLFYRIQEVSRIAGVKPYVLRYWETEFRELSPEKDKNDQRRYRQSDIELVLLIKDLLYQQKFTIAGARLQIQAARQAARSGQNASSGPSRQSVLKGIRAELCDLMQHLSV